MVSWGGRGVTQLCVTSPAPVHLCLGCQLMESGERDIQPQPDPEIDRKVETLVGGVRSQNTDGGLYCARLSAFYLWCAWHNLHLALTINECMPWTESEHKKGVIDNLRGPDVSLYCVQGQELGCVWCRDMISAELCNWLRVFIIISPGPVHLQTLDIPRTIIRHYQPLRLVNSQHAGYSIASASDVASHKSWS